MFFFALKSVLFLTLTAQSNSGFNHFLGCSSLYTHMGPWEFEMYDLINEVSGILKATEEKRNISCLSYAGAMCLNATCRDDSRKALLSYHHCVFNGEYDFCERFSALCASLNGRGACNLCDSHHCNAPPEEGQEGGGEKHNGGGEEKHNGSGEKGGRHMEEKHNDGKEAMTTQPVEMARAKAGGAQQQQGDIGGAGGHAFWNGVFFFGVFVACAMMASVGYRELRKKGFFSGARVDENLI